MYLFVYGTLQPGFGNYRLLSQCALWGVPATTSGTVHWVQGRGGYPVAKLDEEGTIQGTLLCIKGSKPEDDEGMLSAHLMELGAGYEARQIEVAITGGHPQTGQPTVTALAYHYPHKPRGAKIESGDWAAEDRKAQFQWLLSGAVQRLQELEELMPASDLKDEIFALRSKLEACSEDREEPEEDEDDIFYNGTFGDDWNDDEVFEAETI